MKMAALFALVFFSFLSVSNAKLSSSLGVCYGQLGNNLPSPAQSVEYLKSLKTLTALAGTKIHVLTIVPNEIITNISKNQSMSDEWVRLNILPFYPKTKITALLVGNEILSPWQTNKTWVDLVPAMRKVRQSLKKFKLRKIKVGTPLAIDAVDQAIPYPPSNGELYVLNIAMSVMRLMLQFLNSTKSFFFLEAYSYSLVGMHTDPVSSLLYTNLLDQILDSVVFAMTRMGYPNIPIFLAETGWPSDGDVDQIGANVKNLAMAVPIYGTPARPGGAIPTLIFDLYNENTKGGPSTERNWGLLYPTGKPYDYPVLPEGKNNVPYKGKVWCVVAKGVTNMTRGGKCTCYKPISLVAHANYAFSSYWSQRRSIGATCLLQWSYGSCRFPSVTL
ncbi:hypothetical protein MKW94_023583 [Papaver nudicaule]|uniref:X8 domain-containing protein n=1 Tax=Papaver nudicaule TaxID=74823 RepID=A0AA41V9X1_PAPNU|nr:hypothetical protein [Papaver nudicaule]